MNNSSLTFKNKFKMCFQNANSVREYRQLKQRIKQQLKEHKIQMQIMNNYLKQLNLPYLAKESY